MTVAPNIGRYEIRSELGRGGMATVYLAHDPLFERDVALKELSPVLLQDPAFRARFEREARTIASLEHPSIVPVYDFGEDEGRLYLVMRYMSGGSLSDRLIVGPLSLDEIVETIDRLASALRVAHSRGIVHRDLKPANILFDQYGNAHLSDFGIIKLTESTMSLTGSAVIGTPAYMSPEQVHGNLELDGRSDIYSMGIVLFEMLTGAQPYKAGTPAKQMMMHLMDPIPSILALRPDLPESFEELIALAMAKDRDERFAAIDELSATLASMADEAQRVIEPAERPAKKPGELEPKHRTADDIAEPREPETARKLPVDESVANAEVTLPPQIRTANGHAVQQGLKRMRRVPLWGVILGLSIALGAAIGGSALLADGSSTPPAATAAEDRSQLAAAQHSPTVPEPTMTKRPTTTATNAAIFTSEPTSFPSPFPTASIDFSSFASLEIRKLGDYRVNQVAWSPGGSQMAAGVGDGTVRIWDTQSGEQLLVLRSHFGGVRDVAWSADGSLLAAAGAWIWDAENWEKLETLGNVFAWSPDGSYLAHSGEGTGIHIWDATSRVDSGILEDEAEWITSLAWSPDGFRLAAGGFEGTVRLFEIDRERELFRLEGHRASVSALAWSPDGSYLVSMEGLAWRDSETSSSSRIWDPETGEELQIINGLTAWSPNGALLASGHDDGTVRVWGARELKVIHVMEGHADAIACLAWSPDGLALATGDQDGTIRLWDAVSGEALHAFEGHIGFVASLAWSPDGQHLASSGNDGLVRLWGLRQE